MPARNALFSVAVLLNGSKLSELMVVISIVAILGAVAVPTIVSALPGYRLRNAAVDLCSTMRKVRWMAIKQNRNLAINFNSEQKTYTIEENDPIALPEDISFGAGNATSSADDPPESLPSDGISFSSNVSMVSNQGLSSVGYVYLQNSKGQTFAIGALSSGRIVLKSWTGTQWK